MSQCPECTSQKLYKDGVRKTNSGDVQRYLCRDCGRRFSEKGNQKPPQKNQEWSINTQIAEKYDKPITILYFGDYDKKGLQIFNSALKDIRQWCKAKFDVERIGLTIEQAKSMSIPENPNKPGTYQWEALNDEQAGQLIVKAVKKYVSKPSEELLKHEAEIRSGTVKVIQNYLEQCQ